MWIMITNMFLQICPHSNCTRRRVALVSYIYGSYFSLCKRVYVCVCVWACACVCACVWACACTYVCVSMWVCVFVCGCGCHFCARPYNYVIWLKYRIHSRWHASRMKSVSMARAVIFNQRSLSTRDVGLQAISYHWIYLQSNKSNTCTHTAMESGNSDVVGEMWLFEQKSPLINLAKPPTYTYITLVRASPLRRVSVYEDGGGFARKNDIYA